MRNRHSWHSPFVRDRAKTRNVGLRSASGDRDATRARRWLAVKRFIVTLAVVTCTHLSHAADRIVLRDLTIISDAKVAAMTLDGVQLGDGKVIGWDEIETGRLDGGRQELFDKYLENVGVHLFRIRQRLENGDYRSLSPSAEAIAKYYRGRSSATAYMVMQAQMWGRMAQSKHAGAVAPYLHCFEYLRDKENTTSSLPGKRRLKFDPVTGMCDELPPIWFDAAAAKEALPEVASAINSMQKPRPDASRIYYASLALAAGDESSGAGALAGVAENNARSAQLKLILEAQREISTNAPGEKTDQLAAMFVELAQANRPLARYWLGMGKIRGDKVQARREGVLDLLHLPALHAEQTPELAAAALFEAMQTLEELGDLRGSIALRGELLSKYGQTYHAGQLANE